MERKWSSSDNVKRLRSADERLVKDREEEDIVLVKLVAHASAGLVVSVTAKTRSEEGRDGSRRSAGRQAKNRDGEEQFGVGGCRKKGCW